eukprot:m.140539 g.140539  ORF g.140539 m.140539 type:complete len:260 (+) comp38312_c0_seq6:1640-2419(+)
MRLEVYQLLTIYGVICLTAAEPPCPPLTPETPGLSFANIRGAGRDKDIYDAKGRLFYSISCGPPEEGYEMVWDKPGTLPDPVLTRCKGKKKSYDPDVLKYNLRCQMIRCNVTELNTNCRYNASRVYYKGDTIRFQPGNESEFVDSVAKYENGRCLLDSKGNPRITPLPRCQNRTYIWGAPCNRLCSLPEIPHGRVFDDKKLLVPSGIYKSACAGLKFSVVCNQNYKLSGKMRFKCKSRKEGQTFAFPECVPVSAPGNCI